MCSVSVISQYYQNQFPQQNHHSFFGVADDETKRMLRQAVALLDKVDKRLNDIECFDAEKAKFLAQLMAKADKKARGGKHDSV